MIKHCSKCDRCLSVDAFGRNSSAKDGRRSTCKECTNSAMAARKAAEPEKYRELSRLSARKRRAEEPEHNREIQRRANARFREANRESLAAWQREYLQTDRGRDTAYRKVAKRRALVRGAAHEPYSRSAIFAAYGGTCAYCDAPAEHLDHVVPLSKGGADAAHNLLPACAPCNLTKSAKSLAEWAETFGAGHPIQGH